jgi:hypothetical protein
MTATEVQTLIDSVPCDLCNAPPGLAMYLVAAALIDLANGDPVPDTTQELITEANCLLCLVSPGLLPYVMIQAIRGISAGGGGGTGGAGVVGTGSPEGVVTAPPGTIFFDSAGDSLWIKESGVGNTGWTQLLA